MIESASSGPGDQAERLPIESLMASFGELIRAMTWPFPRMDDVLEGLRDVAEQATGWEGSRLVRVAKDAGDGDADPRGPAVLSRQAWAGDRSSASITLQSENRVVGFIEFPDRDGQGWTQRQHAVATLIAQLATSCLTLGEEQVRAAEMTDALEYRATHDELTGLPNRSLLLDRLDHALLADARQPGVVAVMFVDIDAFKELNDSFGHAHGDSVLVSVARQLSGAVRAGDTVGRLGGDEFLVICENLMGTASEIERRLRTLGRRLQRSVAPHAGKTGTDAVVSVSIGVSIGGSACDSEELIRRADEAMYEAKARGDGRIVLADAVVAPFGGPRRLSPGPVPAGPVVPAEMRIRESSAGDPSASGRPDSRQASAGAARS